MDNIKKQYKKLGENTLWMLVGNFATKLLSFFMVPLYTAYLSTADYGIADLMTTTVSLLSPILTVASSEGVLRFTLDKKYDNRQVLSLSILIDVIGFIVLVCVSPILKKHVAFGDYYSLFLIYYLFYNLLWIFQQYSKGINDVKGYAISGFLSTVGSVTSNICFLTIFKIGVLGYLYAQILACVVPVVYLFFREKLYGRVVQPFKISVDLIHKYLGYCLPLIPNQLSWWINNSSDKYILNYYWGLSFTGIYSVAYKIPTILNVIGGIFASSWQISSIENFGTEESEEFYASVYKKYFSLFACVAAGIILFIKPLARVLFAKDFFNAWPYATLLVLASFVQAMGQFYETIYICAMKPTALLGTTILAAVVNTGLNLVLIPQFGAYGASLATFMGYAVMYIVRIIDSRRIFKFKVEHGKNVITISLLIIEASSVCLNVPCWTLIDVVCTIGIIWINREVIKDIYIVLEKLVKRVCK